MQQLIKLVSHKAFCAILFCAGVIFSPSVYSLTCAQLLLNQARLNTAQSHPKIPSNMRVVHAFSETQFLLAQQYKHGPGQRHNYTSAFHYFDTREQGVLGIFRVKTTRLLFDPLDVNAFLKSPEHSRYFLSPDQKHIVMVAQSPQPFVMKGVKTSPSWSLVIVEIQSGKRNLSLSSDGSVETFAQNHLPPGELIQHMGGQGITQIQFRNGKVLIFGFESGQGPSVLSYDFTQKTLSLEQIL